MRKHSALGAVCAFLPLTLAAQVPPDAGRALEDSRTGGQPPTQRPAPPLQFQEPARPALRAPSDFKVFVKSFRFTRNTLFSAEELNALVTSFTGRELRLAELEQAAAAISRHYRERGYFVARAYLPAQDIRDGVVEITVLEGRIGSLRIERMPGTRLTESVVRDTIAARQPEGALIEQRGLERGLLLLNDLGVTTQSTLAPGAQLGTADMLVSVSEGPLITGSVDADSFGNRYTGRYRIGASGFLNDPSGRGDLGSLRMAHAQGLDYLRLGYSLPLGADGLRVSAGAATVRYELCCEFAPLNARGTAQEFSMGAQYPFVRSRDFNLYGSLGATHKDLFNETAAGTTSDKRVSSTTLGLSGDGRDGWLGGGYWSASLSLTAGRLNLDAWAADRAADAASARTQGGYTKVAFSANRLQRLGATTSLLVSLSGQTASRNLDSSEQFALGGPGGVRGYPSGEATGDEGTLVNIELRRELAQDWQLSGFLDHGRIRLHRNEWPGWQGTNTMIRNEYGLSSAGVGLSWVRPGNLSLRVMLAWKLGSNPGRSVTGQDSDNRDDSARLWMQLAKVL